MKKVEYTCDKCGKTINGKGIEGSYMAGSGELCTLIYQGSMGHNKFSTDKHYHYECFCEIVSLINSSNH